MKPFTIHLRNVFDYYSFVFVYPVHFSDLTSFLFTKPLTSITDIILRNRYKLICYIFLRSFVVLHLSALTALLVQCIKILHETGQLQAYDIIGVVLWVCALIPYYFCDQLFLRKDFTTALARTAEICDRIWENAKQNVNQKHLSKLVAKMNLRILLLCLHTSVTDYYNTVEYTRIILNDMEQDILIIYPMVPSSWKTPLFNFFMFPILVIHILIMNLIWGALQTFPGVIVLHLNCCIKSLTLQLDQISNHGDLQVIEKVMKNYNKLEFCINQLSTRRLSNSLLGYYLVVGFQEFAQVFFIFQTLKAGGTFQDVQILLVDAMVKTN